MIWDTMLAMEGRTAWSRLPEEIGERVLSFLPVPALCRCRSVCKTWNHLFRKPSFLDLCDLNRRNEAYLYVTRHSINYLGWCWVDRAYRRKMCFLDLDERRWYSIPVDAPLLAPTDRNVPRLLAMDDGLICELSALSDRGGCEYNVVLFDLVAKSRWELPTSTYEDGPVCGLIGEVLPSIVTVVDNATRSFKLFLMNGPTTDPLSTRFFVYESCTCAWRGLPDIPERYANVPVFAERERGDSAVFFQGNFYIIFWHYESSTVLLLSYSLEGNMWREVLAIPHRAPGYVQLVVTGNRLFMAMWMDYTMRLVVAPGLMSSCANGDGSSGADEEKATFEIKEVLVTEKSSRLLVQISGEDLGHIFDEQIILSDLQVTLTDGFLHKSNSILFISDETGKAVTYDIRTGAFTVLPPHPLKQEQLEEHDSDEEEIPAPLYRAKLVNLSLRNILSGGPVTSGSSA